MGNLFAATFKAFGIPMLADQVERRNLGPDALAAEEDLAVRAGGKRPAQAEQDFPSGPLRADEISRFAMTRPAGIDIFVGGGLDDVPGQRMMKGYSERYRSGTDRPTKYLQHFEGDKVLEEIRNANAGNGPVNVVGHSWGATTAYNAAADARRRGLRVDNLVTLDPVGRLPPKTPGVGREVAESWTNIDAAPRLRDRSDLIASVGGKPSRLPITQADRSIHAPTNHRDVDTMMGAGGRAAMERGRSTASAPAGGLHDGLGLDEWMRQRDAKMLQTFGPR